MIDNPWQVAELLSKLEAALPLPAVITPQLAATLKKSAAPGVDGVTWDQYEAGLPDKLADLHGRV